jgi:hypothetical protein
MAVRIDHVLIGARDLDEGRALVEERLGLPTVIGGRHTDWGTHNALASLGPDVYLEVIAPDPEGPGASILGLATLDRPRPVSVAVRTDDPEAMVAAAGAGGLDLGRVLAGSRQTPDGDTLRWRITDPGADRLGGVVPFGLDWGDTPHPARSLEDHGLRVVEIVAHHPEPDRVTRALTALGLDVRVEAADAPRLEVAFDGPSGEVRLT